MTLADISKRATQEPFRPFAIKTIDGTWIDVEKRSNILLPAARPDLVIVFDAVDGGTYVVGINDIAALPHTGSHSYGRPEAT
jgi:hypothetical protein